MLPMILILGLSAFPVYWARRFMARQRLNRSQLIKLKLTACIYGTLLLGAVHTEAFNQEEIPNAITPFTLALFGAPVINFALFVLNMQSSSYSLVGSYDDWNLVMTAITGIFIFHYNSTTTDSIFESIAPLRFIFKINCTNSWVDLILFLMAKEMRVMENGVVTQEFVWNGKDWISRRPRNQHNGNHREEIMARRERRRSGI